MQNKRWLKVTISYREGERDDQWDAVTLGDTSILQVVEDPRAPALEAATQVLSDQFARAIVELIRRSEQVMPPKPEVVTRTEAVA